MTLSSDRESGEVTPASDRRPPASQREQTRPTRYAGVDLGTNSIRLLVVEVRDGGHLEPILRLGESCRLGEGLDATGEISDVAEARASQTLKGFIRRARALRPDRIHIAATHALRSAANGAEVARRLEESSGLPVQILSGEEEARFVYDAVREALGAIGLPEPCLVIDIGGGSVEIVRGEHGRVTSWLSLDVGCVRLTERFLVGDPPIAEELSRLEAHILGKLAPHPELFEGLVSGAGVGGTLTAMAALDLGLVRYEAARVEGHSLNREAIGRWNRQLFALTNQERHVLPAVGRGRADIIVAGCVILHAVLSHSKLTSIRVSTRGLRYAVVQRMAAERQFSDLPKLGPGDVTPDR